MKKNNNFDQARREIGPDLRLSPNIIMRCYNVNIQYLSGNKSSASVYFPSTKRGKQGTAAKLEI